MKVVANLGTLMRLAKALGDAKKNGTPEEIAAAQARHDEYRDVCLRADEMSTGMTYGQLA